MCRTGDNGASVYRGLRPGGGAVAVTVRGGTIAAVCDVPVDVALPVILPVLVDLQHNGALGLSFSHLTDEDLPRLQRVAGCLRAHGVGRCLATFVTADAGVLRRSALAWAACLGGDAGLARLFPGFFHEGVFISPRDGWRGAHAAQWVRPPTYSAVAEIDAILGGRIRIVNVAPEEPGGLAFVADAVAAGKRVSLGHCCPDGETVAAAVAAGATMVTHFGNGMPVRIHRHHNPVWPFLGLPELHLGLICDGHHLPPTLVAAALECRGVSGAIPVSDAGALSGSPPGRYPESGLGGVVIEPGGRIHLPDSELLAGAWFQLDRGVEFLVSELGLELVDAWHQCSTVPAAFAGIRLPELRVGEEASFVLARWDDGLVIEQAVHAGVPAATHPVRPADAAV